MALHVLVVDDDPHMRHILVRGVEHQGMTTTTASSLAEAKELMESLQPDLVVTDFELGDGDGIELMRFARALGVAAPALLVTATPPPRQETAGLFMDVVAKPFDLNTLLDALYVLKSTLRKPAISTKHSRYVAPAEQSVGGSNPDVMARIVPKKTLKRS